MFSKIFFTQAVTFVAVAVTAIHAAPAVAVVVRNATIAGAGANAAAVDGHLYVCVNSKFDNINAPCNNFDFSVGVCLNFLAPYQDSISSLGPDAGFTCVAYRDINCSGPAVSFQKPGISDLTLYGLNDAITSFACFRS